MESLYVALSGHLVLIVLSAICVLSRIVPDPSSGSSDLEELDILMRDAKPLQPDAYLCTSYAVDYEEAYIYKFEALAEASTAHHMLLYGCDGEPADQRSRWDCPPMCQSGTTKTIMFAWAKNAPPTTFPKDVGLRIGKKSSIKTIILQIHYAKAFTRNSAPDQSGLKLFITRQRQLYSAGILLMVSGFFQIPPRQSDFHVDISCRYTKANSIFPFAYRTHAHGRGKVITGYQNNGSYHEIGKGNPQWPQTFYPTKSFIEIKHGDYLAGRCTYDSSKYSHVINVGATGDDEMCNFYIMYYTNSSFEDKPFECFNNVYPGLTGDSFPDDVSVPLPHNAKLEEEAQGHHHSHPHAGTATPEDKHEPHSEAPDQNRILSNRPSEEEASKTRLQANIGNGKNAVNYSHTKKAFNRQQSTSLKEPVVKVKPKTEVVSDNGYPISDGENTMGDKQQPVFYDFNNINPRDLSHKNRVSQEYYDDYAANDRREQAQYRDPDAEIELSRNRNKEFDAMDKQLQQQYSHNRNSNSRPSKTQYHQKQRGSLDHHSETGSRMPTNQGNFHPGQSNHRKEHGNGAKHSETPHSTIHIEKKMVYQPSWPSKPLDIGQVGGVSTDRDGNVYIFHRASRMWVASSFDHDNNFRYQDVPIDEDVVLVLDKNGNLIRKFGKGQYFMPHGINVDEEGNIWLTDVALHQVFKIPKNAETPILTLGQRFQPSEDLNYFCKPADVAVLSTGEFFVADGYCNGRVVKFSKDGKVLKYFGKKWGESREPSFNVVHSLAVSEKDNKLCAADRENGRIQCFDLEGNFKQIIKHKEFGSRLFAIDYSPLHGGVMYAINGPDGVSTVQGFTLEMKNGALIDQWNLPQGLKNPHAVCVDPTMDSIYVGELDPRNVWKMTRMSKEEAAAIYHNLNHPHGDHDHDDDDDDDGDDHKKSDKDSKSQKNENEAKQTSVTDPPSDTTKVANSTTPSNSTELSKRVAHEGTGLSISMIMGIVLVVPVVLLLIVVLIVRNHKAGNFKFFVNGGGKNKRIFNMQNILGNSHKGFDPLSTEESDHDLDPNDSDQEEYAAPKRPKS